MIRRYVPLRPTERKAHRSRANLLGRIILTNKEIRAHSLRGPAAGLPYGGRQAFATDDSTSERQSVDRLARALDVLTVRKLALLAEQPPHLLCTIGAER